MRRVFLFQLILICTVMLCQAQALQFEWVNGVKRATMMVKEIDAGGNLYSIGSFHETTDFDPGTRVTILVNNGLADFFIAKHNSSGELLWANGYGGSLNDWGLDLLMDNSGSIYAIAEYAGTVDFDPGPGTAIMSSIDSYDVALLKLDSNGNLIWVKSFGGLDKDMVSKIEMDANGNLYISGFFYGQIDFDPGPGISSVTSNGDADVYLTKFDSDGNLLWYKTFGSTGYDVCYGMDMDNFANICLTGHFYNTVDFDPGSGVTNLTSNGHSDIFLAKLDSFGNLSWAHSFGSTNIGEVGYAIDIDNANNIWLTGVFKLSVDFDPGLPVFTLSSNGALDAFIAKYSASGGLMWAGSIGGSGDDTPKAIVADYSGNIYVNGNFENQVDFDPGFGIANYS